MNENMVCTGNQSKSISGIPRMCAGFFSDLHEKNYAYHSLTVLENWNSSKYKYKRIESNDVADLELLSSIMDPMSWKRLLFNEEVLRACTDSEGKQLSGTYVVRTEDGKPVRREDGSVKTVDIPHDEATFEELRNTVILRYLNPLAPRIAYGMKSIYRADLNEMKPSMARAWIDLAIVMKFWSEPDIIEMYDLLESPDPKIFTDLIFA